MPSTTTNRAPGMALGQVAAVAGPDHRIVGPVDDYRRRSDAARVAQQAAGAEDRVELTPHSLRIIATGRTGSSTRRRNASVGGKKLGPLMIEMLRTSLANRSSHAASLAGASKASLITRHRGSADSGLPELDMISPSDASRSGLLPASTWAIMPPIDAPTTWARSMLEVVEQPFHVAGEVDQRVGHRAAPAQQIAPDPRVEIEPLGASAAHLGRQAGVAMIEADDPDSRGRPADRRNRPATSAAAHQPP